MVTIQTGVSGYGAVFVQRETGYEWVVDLGESSERHRQLQPGQYKVVFRSKFAQETAYSKNKELEWSSSSTIVKINKMKKYSDTGKYTVLVLSRFGRIRQYQ